MKYVFLALAIIFEVIGSTYLKLSEGFSKTIPTFIMIISYLGCFYFLSHAVKTLPLGMVYAIWAGVGIALTVAVSVIIFRQSIDWLGVLGIALILGGVVVLTLFSKALK